MQSQQNSNSHQAPGTGKSKQYLNDANSNVPVLINQGVGIGLISQNGTNVSRMTHGQVNEMHLSGSESNKSLNRSVNALAGQSCFEFRKQNSMSH